MKSRQAGLDTGFRLTSVRNHVSPSRVYVKSFKASLTGPSAPLLADMYAATGITTAVACPSTLPTQITYSTRPRVLKRPYGGWSARQWRRESLNGIFAALCVTGSWASVQTMIALASEFAQLLN